MMMTPNSLVIDCSIKTTPKNPELINAIRKFSKYNVIGFREVSSEFEIGKDIDAVVVSGSAARITGTSDRDKFKHVKDLIEHLDRPLFSICFGHQLLCWSLGAKAAPLSEKIKRFEEVKIVNYDAIFEGFEKDQTIPLAEHHNDYVIKMSLQDAKLILLADSKSCEVEAIRHRQKPFYGVQFHPERTKINGETHLEGLEIIENFYKYVVKR